MITSEVLAKIPTSELPRFPPFPVQIEPAEGVALDTKLDVQDDAVMLLVVVALAGAVVLEAVMLMDVVLVVSVFVGAEVGDMMIKLVLLWLVVVLEPAHT